MTTTAAPLAWSWWRRARPCGAAAHAPCCCTCLARSATRAHTTLLQPIAAHAADAGIVAEALGPTPWFLLAHADPLYAPAAGSAKLAQKLGSNLWPEWKLDVASAMPTFNVDAILQATAWRRLAGHPGLAGQTQAQFFNSAAWTSVLQAHPELTVTVLTLRAANIDV